VYMDIAIYQVLYSHLKTSYT